MNKIAKAIFFILMLFIPLEFLAQQPKQIKVSEFSVSHISTIEERVFLIHSILDKGYFCYKNENNPNIIDVYVPSDATDELSDFDFFFDNILYDQLNEFHNLDKNIRGEIFVQWRQGIDDEIYHILYDDFTKGLREGGNGTCDGALPFCTNNGIYDFPAGVNTGSVCGNTPYASCSDPYACTGTPGQSYNCLSTTPNPAFYFMRIGESGNLDIHMHSEPPVDIDFDCWGPFNDIDGACNQLACSNIVDCGYSTSWDEHCYINNAQPGQYYILLITNFSNYPCNIYFENISGTGTTDCSILPPIVNNDGPYCVGETIHLTAMGLTGASYSWTGPNGWHWPYQNPNNVLTNCTMDMAGPYICTISKEGHGSACDTTWVVIYPKPVASFTATTACVGSATQFDASSSTMNPSQYNNQQFNIASYEWDFGDGTTGSGVTTSHQYAQAGTYQVTLHVSDAEGHCSDEVIQPVMVVSPTAENYYVTICEGESYTLNGVTYSQEGDYPVTIQAEGCESTATLHLTVIDLDVQIEVIPNDSICQGDTVTLHANSSYELVAVGDILCTDGIIVKPYHWPCGKTAKGIVFYVNDTHLHGYAVSLTQSGPMKWSTQYAIKIATYSHWRDAIADFNGYNNTQILRTGTTAATYPAAWAVDFDNGWYLPAAGQVNLLFGELVDVNVSLILVGGTPIVDTTGTYGVSNGDVYLWSSTEWNRDQAMTVKVMDGWVRSYDKGTTVNKHYVRSVINF